MLPSFSGSLAIDSSLHQTQSVSNQGAAFVVGPNAAPWPQPTPAVPVISHAAGSDGFFSNPTNLAWGIVGVGAFVLVLGMVKKLFGG